MIQPDDPVYVIGAQGCKAPGIELRTWIATHALQGILAANYLNDGLGKQQAFIFINDAVFLADELINALNQPTNTTAP